MAMIFPVSVGAIPTKDGILTHTSTTTPTTTASATASTTTRATTTTRPVLQRSTRSRPHPSTKRNRTAARKSSSSTDESDHYDCHEPCITPSLSVHSCDTESSGSVVTPISPVVAGFALATATDQKLKGGFAWGAQATVRPRSQGIVMFSSTTSFSGSQPQQPQQPRQSTSSSQPVPSPVEMFPLLPPPNQTPGSIGLGESFAPSSTCPKNDFDRGLSLGSSLLAPMEDRERPPFGTPLLSRQPSHSQFDQTQTQTQNQTTATTGTGTGTPAVPRAPTFDSPGRFTSRSSSYPSPVQAGFRTPVSKASSSTRREGGSGSAKVARALTFGDEDGSGSGSGSGSGYGYGYASGLGQGPSPSPSQSQSQPERYLSHIASPPSVRSYSSRSRASESDGFHHRQKRSLDTWNESNGDEEERDGAVKGVRGTGLLSPPEGAGGLRRVHTGSTMGMGMGVGERERSGTLINRRLEVTIPEPMDEEFTPVLRPPIGSPTQTLTQVQPPLETGVPGVPTPSISRRPEPVGYINMGEGLAGGPQRDSNGKKINIDRWRENDPLTAGPEPSTGGNKKLGGFKERFSQSLLNLIGQGKGENKSDVRTGDGTDPSLMGQPDEELAPPARARRLLFGRKSPIKEQERIDAPPVVPQRSSSYKNQNFLRQRAKTQPRVTKSIPFSPSMPILSESLHTDPTDARIMAWLSTTSLAAEPVEKTARSRMSMPAGTMNWATARDQVKPAKRHPIDTTTYAFPAVRTAPVKEEATEKVEKKKRPRSLARLSSLFSRRSTPKPDLLGPTTPVSEVSAGRNTAGNVFPPLEDRRASDTSQGSLAKFLKNNRSREALDNPDSRWQKKRSSGDWRKLLQSQTNALKPEEADHFASIINAPSPILPTSRSTTPAIETQPAPVTNKEEAPADLVDEDQLLGMPLDKRLSRLSEVQEEEDAIHANNADKVKLKRTITPVRPGYVSTGTQTDPIPGCAHCSNGNRAQSSRLSFTMPLERKRTTQSNHQKHLSISSTAAPSEFTEVSGFPDEDVHIQTVLSSPVHSIPGTIDSPQKYALEYRKLSLETDMLPLHASTPTVHQASPIELEFPLPPGYRSSQVVKH